MELVGVATFLLALLQYLGRESNEIRLSVAASGKLGEEPQAAAVGLRALRSPQTASGDSERSAS
jgi:hypothetical protein